MKYSIRMRSAKGGAHEQGGCHISGAERIISKEELNEMAQALIQRALNHSKGEADFIRITIDAVKPEETLTAPLLKVADSKVEDYQQGRKLAVELLSSCGVNPLAAAKAMATLSRLEDNYRGALLIDAASGERLDQSGNRGIRVSRMDYATPEATLKELIAAGYTNVHFREALVLASKVLSAPGVVAELCWSDDPDYVTGYVSGHGTYHRISHMKPMNSPLGGRVFFINTEKINSLDTVIDYLQNQVVLVK